MPLETVQLSTTKGPTDVRPGGGSGEPFQPTAEELRSIQEKMKDPKFVELMHEYMQSLQDPETRREEEAYLEQAEREAREGGDYSFEFIFPRPQFAVELLNPTTRRVTASEARKVGSGGPSGYTEQELKEVRTFVNMCSSEKVEQHREERTSGRDSNWQVPVAVSAKRLEALPSAVSLRTDGRGLCYVYDAVYNPLTLSLAERSAKFLCFLVEIAVEQINAGYKESNGFEFHRLPSAVTAVGTPQNQTVRKKNGASPFAAVDTHDPVLTRPTKHLYPESRPTDSEAATAAGRPAPPTRETETAAAATTRLPPFTIAHRGRIDMSDAWQWKVSDQRVGVPEELVVKLTFAGATRAAALDIAVTEDGSALRIARTPAQDAYEGLIVLPFTVDLTPRKAALDRSTGTLTITLRVVPPTLPEADRAVAEEVRRRFIGDSITPLATEAAVAVTPPATEAVVAVMPPAPLAPPSIAELTQDTERGRAAMAKVMEARKAREAASGEAAASVSPAEPPAPVSSEPAAKVDSTSEPLPFIQKRDPVREAEVAELHARQEAWAAMAREQMAAMAAREEAEAAEVARQAELEKAKAARRLAAAKEVEAAEGRARAKMDAVPLANKYLFAID